MDPNNNQESGALRILLLVMLVLVLLIMVFLIYQLYLNIPRSPENLNVNIKNQNPSTNQIPNSSVTQFYENMKFNHNLITYNIDPSCDTKTRGRMEEAFDIIEEQVSSLTFREVNSNEDIKITCSREGEESIVEKHFIAGEGGAKEIIQTQRYNVITQGVIFIYKNPEIRTINCDYPNVEMHELMHVFGFDHTDDKNSLMNPLLDSCNQVLDQGIIQQLIILYSEENLPDLYFEDVKAVKKGRYLDFNITIKNSGSVDSENVSLTIIEDNKIIDRRDLGYFGFGSGITIQTTNLKLDHLNPNSIEFVIDRE